MTLRLTLLDWSVPITKWAGHLHAPFSHKRIKAKHYHDVKHFLKRGAIFVTQTRGEFSNLLIPGFWGHVAINVGNGYVVEAIGAGVVKTDIFDFMFSKDSIALLNPIFTDDSGMENAADWAEEQVGLSYDYKMQEDGLVSRLPLPTSRKERAFYCSKLGYLAYKETMNESPFVLRSTFGIMTVTPQDFVNATTSSVPKFTMVWNSQNVGWLCVGM